MLNDNDQNEHTMYNYTVNILKGTHRNSYRVVWKESTTETTTKKRSKYVRVAPAKEDSLEPDVCTSKLEEAIKYTTKTLRQMTLFESMGR